MVEESSGESEKLLPCAVAEQYKDILTNIKNQLLATSILTVLLLLFYLILFLLDGSAATPILKKLMIVRLQ